MFNASEARSLCSQKTEAIRAEAENFVNMLSPLVAYKARAGGMAFEVEAPDDGQVTVMVIDLLSQNGYTATDKGSTLLISW